MPIISSTIQNLAVNKMSAPYYRLDGANDYITVTDNASLDVLDGDFSIEMVIKSEGPVTSHESPLSRYIVSGEAGMYIYINQSTGGVSMRFNDSVNGEVNLGTTGLDIRNDGKWHHLVWSMDRSGNGLVYVDAVLVNTVDISAKNANCNITQTLNIGYTNASAQQFDGSICSVRQWNLALTATEVKELYSGASVPYKYKGANQTANYENDFSSVAGFVNYSQTVVALSSEKLRTTMDTTYGYIRETISTVLTIGKAYRLKYDLKTVNSSSGIISNVQVGDNGTYGAGTNQTDGTDRSAAADNISWEFVATGAHQYIFFQYTGTVATDYFEMDNFSIVPIGAVAEYDGSGIASDKWFDKSGNDLHGTVSGATVENAPTGDDGLVYEEGTMTPTILLGGTEISTNSGTYNTAQTMGSYTRIGNRVLFNMRVGIANKGNETGAIRVAGLPYTPASSPNAVSAASLTMWVVSYADTPFANIGEGTTSIGLFETTNAGTYTTLTDGNIGVPSFIQVAGQYHI
jgi:hypothetical protein